MTTPRRASRPERALLASISTQAAAILPAYLAGALALQLHDDLGVSEGGLGIALSLCFIVAASTSSWLGRVTDRLGPERAMRTAAVLSAASLLTSATAARNFPLLVLTLGISGFSLGLAGPATKVLVARGVRDARQGLAFGLQAGAVPLASFLAGLAASTLANPIGWRLTFGVAAVLPVIGLLATPTLSVDRPVRNGDDVLTSGERTPLVVLSAGVALGAAAATTTVSFFVVAASATGLAGETAGSLLALGSAVVIVARIIAAVLSGRSTDPLRAVVVMMAVSTVGYALAAVDSSVVMPAAALTGLAFGWSWSGVVVHAVVRAYADTPGHATGMVSAGQSLGGVFGPPAFGFCAEHLSYAASFLLVAGFATFGAVCVSVARRGIGRPRPGVVATRQASA